MQGGYIVVGNDPSDMKNNYIVFDGMGSSLCKYADKDDCDGSSMAPLDRSTADGRYQINPPDGILATVIAYVKFANTPTDETSAQMSYNVLRPSFWNRLNTLSCYEGQYPLDSSSSFA